MSNPDNPLNDPSLTIALALALGLGCQIVARHLRIPGLLLLLVMGVIVGPEVLGLIYPQSLQTALPILVHFAVAIILFEGGMNLNLARLRREQRSIQLLITLGAVVTAVGGTLAAHYIMGWEWRVAAVFGTLVIVTGPTVIGPLLKRVKVERSVATVLEAEGVLIDAVGAIAAAAALEFAISGGADVPILSTLTALGFGVILGFAGGLGLALLLKVEDLIPEGLENVLTLALVCAIFHISNAVFHESGIAAVTVAGIVVGNVPIRAHRELLEFKEQLTVMFIGMLFILLAADVGLKEVLDLGWPGVATVLTLMLVVRPLNVFAGTIGSGLNWRQRTFLSWIGPRGIVAAAVASLVASALGDDQPGPAFRALVFSVIAATVISAGLTGGLLARLLGLKRPSNSGWVILGANELARSVARALEAAGEPSLCIDQSPEATRGAQQEGIRVIYGNGLHERSLLRAEIDTRRGAIGLSPSGEVNLLFVQKAKHEGKLRKLYVALSEGAHGVTSEMVASSGAEVLFDHRADVEVWTVRLRRGFAEPQVWEYCGPPETEKPPTPDLPEGKGRSRPGYLFLVFQRDGQGIPASPHFEPQEGDRVSLLIHTERAEHAADNLELSGWRPVAEPVPSPEES